MAVKAKKKNTFETRLSQLIRRYNSIANRKNPVDPSWDNGWFSRYKYPVVTNEHVPLHWRYDLDPKTNPRLLERLGINVAFNTGAIEMDGKILLVARVEGFDRKSFFAVAESKDGINGFKFWEYPILLDQTNDPDTNVYDMRLVKHEDGWIYGTFCTERKDPKAPRTDTSSAVAACGIVRTKDLKSWQRLPDLKSDSPQQRNVVVHPEFIDGKYALYTRPQDDFIKAGTGGGIAWALTDSMENAVVHEEKVMDPRVYHTIKEVKNGMGPAPIKTSRGWLHVAHGVRNTAAGLRYVLYGLLCDLKDPSKVIARPGGYFIANYGGEQLGDVSNVTFCNGMVARDNGDLLIYYCSSDTRIHLAKTTVETVLDFVQNTPEDPLLSHKCVEQRIKMIQKNYEVMKKNPKMYKGIC